MVTKVFYKEKDVLVTGGSGFVGTHIVQELLKQEAKVHVPVNRRALCIKDKCIKTIHADLTSYKECLRAVEGMNYVFHAAGPVGSAAAGTSMADITTSLNLLSQMLRAAWESNVERFLLFSSSTSYPVADFPVKEEDMQNGPPHHSYIGYGWMRRYFEHLGEFVASQSNMKIAIVRPTAVYGRWDNFDPKTCHVIPALVRKAVERCNPYEVWGTGEELRDFLHITDLAKGSLSMLERHATCDPVNIGYGKSFKISDIVKMILKAAGYENAKVVFNSTKPTNIPSRMVDTAKARRVLDFEPGVSMEEGIKDIVEWYKEECQASFGQGSL